MEDWRVEAKCRNADADLFFPFEAVRNGGDRSESTRISIQRNRQAKQICTACPVRLQCLRAHIREPWGIFGGFSADERSAIRNRGIPLDVAMTMLPPKPGPKPKRTPGPNGRPAAYVTDEKRRECFLHYVDKKKSIKDTAKEVGISHAVVRRILADVVRTDAQGYPKKEIPEEDVRMVVKLYVDEKYSMRAVRELTGFGRDRIRSILSSAGHKPRPVGRSSSIRAPEGQWYLRRAQMFDRLFAEGLSGKEVADRAGCHIDTVYRHRARWKRARAARAPELQRPEYLADLREAV
jgi:WhiB family redox-sensing transcriptional regulator